LKTSRISLGKTLQGEIAADFCAVNVMRNPYETDCTWCYPTGILIHCIFTDLFMSKVPFMRLNTLCH